MGSCCMSMQLRTIVTRANSTVAEPVRCGVFSVLRNICPQRFKDRRSINHRPNQSSTSPLPQFPFFTAILLAAPFFLRSFPSAFSSELGSSALVIQAAWGEWERDRSVAERWEQLLAGAWSQREPASVPRVSRSHVDRVWYGRRHQYDGVGPRRNRYVSVGSRLPSLTALLPARLNRCE